MTEHPEVSILCNHARPRQLSSGHQRRASDPNAFSRSSRTISRLPAAHSQRKDSPCHRIRMASGGSDYANAHSQADSESALSNGEPEPLAARSMLGTQRRCQANTIYKCFFVHMREHPRYNITHRLQAYKLRFLEIVRFRRHKTTARDGQILERQLKVAAPIIQPGLRW